MYSLQQRMAATKQQLAERDGAMRDLETTLRLAAQELVCRAASPVLRQGVFAASLTRAAVQETSLESGRLKLAALAQATDTDGNDDKANGQGQCVRVRVCVFWGEKRTPHASFVLVTCSSCRGRE